MSAASVIPFTAADCRLVTLARQRQQRDRDTGAERGLVWDQDAADRVIKFWTLLRFHEGEWAGKPFALQPWQERDILRPLFGWKRKDGTRRFRTAYIELPRKNGKTDTAAGMGLYLLIADMEPGAQVYSTATKRDQAKIVTEMAQNMVRLSPELLRHAEVFKSSIYIPALGARMQPLSSDSKKLDGLNPHVNIVDELHAHRDSRILDVMTTAMGARRQPLTIMITTAGVYDPESVAWRQHEQALGVLEGTVEDDSLFAYIAAADADDDWTDPETWRRANPNWGISVKPDFIRELADKAKRQPSFQSTFRRLHLNQWTQERERWIEPAVWDACNAEADDSELDGAEAFCGLDLAATRDLSALVLVLPDADGTLDVLARFWAPEDRIQERSLSDSAPYRAWAEQGWLTPTPGAVTDYDIIQRDILDLAGRYDIREIGYDEWNASHMAQGLEAEGLTMVKMRQGFGTLSGPSKLLETLVYRQRIAHRGNPILRWMMSHCSLERDAADNIKPSKKRSTDRIDGIVALVMALDRASRHHESIYGGQDLLVVGGDSPNA